jgi:hypothetical protein
MNVNGGDFGCRTFLSFLKISFVFAQGGNETLATLRFLTLWGSKTRPLW